MLKRSTTPCWRREHTPSFAESVQVLNGNMNHLERITMQGLDYVHYVHTVAYQTLSDLL